MPSSRPVAAVLAASLLLSVPLAADPLDTRHVKAVPVASTLPANWQHGAFMEIFVRGYQDSNGDGIGDLNGLTQRLDYLQQLGIRGIWLMPIMASADHDHGYATVDFRGIEADYGSLADFDELLREAHKRGMGVIIDYVVNHSSAQHPMFADASKGPGAKYRNWYVWQKTVPEGWDIWGSRPWTTTPTGAYFGTFGPHMPDFNMRNPKVVAYHEDSLRFWLNRGLDGYRFDAVPHLIENNANDWNDQPESRALTNRLRALVQSYPQRHVVCEATASPEAYAAPDICGSAFAFGLQYEVVKAAKGDTQAIAKVADYFKTAPQSMATMVSNHDIFAGDRLWDQVNGDLAQYKLAAASYLLLPGTPFIYYGEEIGMAGVKGLAGDAPLRAPMSWNASGGFSSSQPFRPLAPNVASQNAAAEQATPDSIFAFYKAMLGLRNSLPSIAAGSYEAPLVDGQVFSFQRKLDKERTLVLINYGPARSLNVGQLPANTRLEPRYPANAAATSSNGQGQAELQLPAQSVAVYRLPA